jgi:hypothetical protein
MSRLAVVCSTVRKAITTKGTKVHEGKTWFRLLEDAGGVAIELDDGDALVVLIEVGVFL